MRQIAILGGGGWGTALAIVLSRSPQAPRNLRFGCTTQDSPNQSAATVKNKTYLPGPNCLKAFAFIFNWKPRFSGAQVILGAMPSAHARAIYASGASVCRLRREFRQRQQGLEPSTHLRMSEVIAQIVSPKFVRASP